MIWSGVRLFQRAVVEGKNEGVKQFVPALKPATEYAFEFLSSWEFSLNVMGRLKSVWQ